MSEMFIYVDSFNQPLEWTLNEEVDIDNMFEGATAYTYGELKRPNNNL